MSSFNNLFLNLNLSKKSQLGPIFRTRRSINYIVVVVIVAIIIIFIIIIIIIIRLKYVFGPLTLEKVMFWSLNFEKCVFGPFNFGECVFLVP